MDGTEIYRCLEEAFVSTFLDELIPGIFHNYANPLNGIMGRSNLLQRRLVDFVKKIENRYPDIEKEMGGDYKKLISDINAINSESEKFYDMFRASAGKFYAIGNQFVEKLNLSRLIEAEVGFADFYLDFKHNIKKEIRLDPDLPDISGRSAYYSMAVWMLMRLAMNNIKGSSDKKLFMATVHDDKRVALMMTNIGNQLMSEWQEDRDHDLLSGYPQEQKNLCYALLLLKQGSDGVEITYDKQADMLTVSIPYHHSKGGLET